MKNFLIEDGKQLVLDIVDKVSAETDGKETTLTAQLVSRVPLTYSDFQLARDETWWLGVRNGSLEPDLESHEMRVIPGGDAGDGMVDGYTIRLSRDGSSYSRKFSIRSMSNVAQREITRLFKDDDTEISLDDNYSYYLSSIAADEQEADPAPEMRVKSCREPLLFDEGRLADYMRVSETLVGVSEPPPKTKTPPMQIFVTQDVWDESKEHAHRGGEQESAALFSGRLFRDTDSPEVFVRIDACLEAAHAVEEKLSVTFTGDTWAHARELLEMRRKRLGRPQEIIVGSVHRHPFMPSADANGQRKCEICEVAEYCTRSTAVPSGDDFEWHRSVFAGQPYTTLLIWGYNAREEEDFRLYGLHNATFSNRTLRLLRQEP